MSVSYTQGENQLFDGMQHMQTPRSIAYIIDDQASHTHESASIRTVTTQTQIRGNKTFLCQSAHARRMRTHHHSVTWDISPFCECVSVCVREGYECTVCGIYTRVFKKSNISRVAVNVYTLECGALVPCVSCTKDILRTW